MKQILTFILLTVIVINSYSQSYPVAVDDSANVRLGDYVTINVLENDYHPEGSFFRLDTILIFEAVSFTDSTLTYFIDYERYYNYSGEKRMGYRLLDENGQWGDESWGRIHLNVINEYSDSLDLNNIKALINPYGLHFWDGTSNDYNHFYEFPKGSGKNTIFASAFWVGGIDQYGQLRLSAERYRLSGADYWSGPLSIQGNLSIDTQTVVNWNRIWKLDKDEVEYHKYNWNQPGYEPIDNIVTWPANGDTTLQQSYYLAQFVDIDGDGNYDPYSGDYPLVKGDTMCVFYF